MMANFLDGSSVHRPYVRRLREEVKATSLRQDPYSLAYRYVEYMRTYRMQQRLGDRQDFNTYYEKLFANQPEPNPDATDDCSRAIRYAKDHYECYYQIRDIARIVGWLNVAEETQVSVEMTTLLAAIGSQPQRAHETSSPSS